MDEQLTAQKEREYVEARWIFPKVWFDAHMHPGGAWKFQVGDGPDCAVLICMPPEVLGPANNQDGTYHAARAFTKQREREIAEVEEEIAWLYVGQSGIGPVFHRILAVEQARLAELRRGMQEGSE